MEIENKYTIADAARFARWRAVTAVGAYALGPEAIQVVVDYYFDSPHWAFARQGYACRLREKSGSWRATLKSLARNAPTAQAALHQRLEHEVDLVGNAHPMAWPASPARALALQLLGNEGWQELCIIQQRRHVRKVLDQARLVAEWSLDEVTLGPAERPEKFWELEVELRPMGTLTDLEALAAELTMLKPQPVSKFERALARSGLTLVNEWPTARE